MSGENAIASAQDVANVEAYVCKVQAIREVLKRDHMKVAFFGRYICKLSDVFILLLLIFNIIFLSSLVIKDAIINHYCYAAALTLSSKGFSFCLVIQNSKKKKCLNSIKIIYFNF